MTVKDLAKMLRNFEEEGLGLADTCIINNDNRFEDIHGARLDRTSAFAIVVLLQEGQE